MWLYCKIKLNTRFNYLFQHLTFNKTIYFVFDRTHILNYNKELFNYLYNAQCNS